VERFLLRVLAAAAAVLVASALFSPLVQASSLVGTALFAVILGLLNAVVRPVLLVLTFPLTLLTLGLFLFVLNALVFWLATLVPGGGGVRVEGFLGALVGALTVGVVSFVADRVFA
jgi:putative membrane protein